MSLSESYPRGPRLSFRDFTAGDISAVHEFAADPEVTRWSTWGPNTLEQTTSFVTDAAHAHLEEGRSTFSFAAVLEGKVIGSVAIWITDPDDRNGELGYSFHRSYWGNGYATEATSQLLKFGFDTLKLERISATCHPGNIGSIRVLEKAGFTLEGRLRSHRLVRGARRDSLLYSILREEHDSASADARAGQENEESP
ncbi:GNAT family N-acetyltransferase [Arthrobacter sp.]|uniref:GNAT family N-acetyltransferase n=1 Tax=Arthrobacter sp. TaxID=1667 RepID=UPI0026DF8100|nr:GNAT family N-acetyltransferase [Arthrobacter sp.]MDO5754329.1 GNAT family N-acetyltransferase [Arthrobacter sp.]